MSPARCAGGEENWIPCDDCEPEHAEEMGGKCQPEVTEMLALDALQRWKLDEVPVGSGDDVIGA